MDSLLWRYLWLTVLQAALSALLSGAVGLWAALAFTESAPRLKKYADFLSFICFALPSILVVLAFFSVMDALAGFGFLGWPAVLCAHTFLNFGIFYQNTSLALKSFDRSEELSALSLGASRRLTFYKVTLPKVLPALRGSFVTAFLYCTMSFLVILMLGGGPKFTTLEVALYQAIKVNFDLALALKIGAIQLSIGLLFYIWDQFQRQPVTTYAQGIRWVALFPVRVFPIVVILCVLCLGPLVSLLVQSVRYLFQLESTIVIHAAVRSLALATVCGSFSTIVSLLLGYLSIRSDHKSCRWLSSLGLGLPLVISSLLTSLVLLYCFPWARNQYPWLMILLAQVFLSLPVASRPIRDSLSSIPVSLYQSARSLGAGRWQILQGVELPMLRNALAVAFLFSAAFSLGEVGSVLIFAQQDTLTLPLLLYRWMAAYRFSDAMGASVVLLGIFFVVFLTGQALQRRVHA